jgi:uncharacterized membrane protein YbhN (UPF0104 family)
MPEARRTDWRRICKQWLGVGARNTRRWSRILVALVVGASIAALVYGVIRNWQELATYHWEITYWPIPIAMLLYGIDIGLAVAIWGSIVRRMGGASRWVHDLRIYCASNLARRLPTPIWFVLGRVYLYEELGVSKAISSLATVAEGVLVLFSGLVTLLVFLPLVGGAAFLGHYTWAIVGLAIGCLFLVLRPQSLRWTVNWLAQRLGRGEAVADDLDYRHMLLWTGLYSIVWIVGGLIFYLLLRMVYLLPVHHLPAVVGIWVAGGVVSHVAVFLPGGLGLKELTMAALLSALVPMPIAILVSVVARLWFSLNELLWLLLSSRLARDR